MHSRLHEFGRSGVWANAGHEDVGDGSDEPC
jgi:hypothetical protein